MFIHIIRIIFFLTFASFAGNVYAVLRIVAAESVYGDLAQQLGGEYVQVRSILNSPNQDPHIFSVTPSIAKAVADADVVILNGLGYDGWMEKLLSNSGPKERQILNVAQLLGKKKGENPHLWYNPDTMPRVAERLVHIFQEQDPIHRDYYTQRLAQFQKDYQSLTALIASMKQRFPGISMIAIEPVFDDMAEALGWVIVEKGLAQSVMNHVEPTPSQIKQFEDALVGAKNFSPVRVMIYNNQVNAPLTLRLKELAKQAHIPTMGIAEVQPKGMNYVQWMTQQLNELTGVLHNVH